MRHAVLLGAYSNPTSDELWTRDVSKVEQLLVDRYIKDQDNQSPDVEGNSDGYLGQDAIMRVLGLQVIPGNGEDDSDFGMRRTNFGVKPAYEFNPGSRSIILITGSDTTVERFGTFDVERPDEQMIPDLADHDRRNRFHDWILEELDEEDIAVHTITPELFGANAQVETTSVTVEELQNRSRMHIFPELSGDEFDEWVADDNYIYLKENADEDSVNRPLYLLFGSRTDLGDGPDDKSYLDQLNANCLLEVVGNVPLTANNWSIRSRVKRFSSLQTSSGSIDLIYGLQTDFAETGDSIPSSAGVRVHVTLQFSELVSGNLGRSPVRL